MNFAEFAQKWGRATPDAPAIALGANTVFTYADLADRAARLAAGLTAQGLAKGDRIAILQKNGVHYLECMVAIWHAGLAAVPINAKLHADEIAYIIEHSGAKLTLVSPELTHAVLGDAIVVPSTGSIALMAHEPMLVEPVRADDLAWLFYTSGTTGRPKGAMITHRNLRFACQCYATDIDPNPPWSSILHPAPFSHGSGLYGLAHLVKGSCQVFPRSGGFDAAEIFDLVGQWPGCAFFAAPTMINTLTRFANANPSASLDPLKCIIFGGAPMLSENIKAFLDRFGPRLAQLYGQGEAPMTISGMNVSRFADRSNPNWERRIASAGLPQTGVEIKIVKPDGAPCAPYENGEIICRSDAVVPGYWRNDEATAQTFRDGWLWTGDIGHLDDAGYLTITDRSKDMIISGGSNIYPREVEEVLATQSNVREVSVIGIPDAHWGEIVVAYIVGDGVNQPKEADLDALCLEKLARFKRPKHYRFIESLPKNNYGKILKTRLREMEAETAQPKA